MAYDAIDNAGPSSPTRLLDFYHLVGVFTVVCIQMIPLSMSGGLVKVRVRGRYGPDLIHPKGYKRSTPGQLSPRWPRTFRWIASEKRAIP
jgi:hypothetical protein